MFKVVNSYSSKLVENTVNELAKLPGIGKKTALRLTLHLIKQDLSEVEALSKSILRMRNEIKFCKICFNISDSDICEICANPKRDHSIICIVEDIRDVMAIENTAQYKGIYHILGGIISPMDGIGPNDLNIESLINKVAQGNINEIIMALSTTIEGDTTIFYIYKKIKDFNLTITTIARGVAIGDELEYTDEITLGRSIINRT
ncbi:MAG: recombination protein RecR, partial [Bacteroidales bacterium]|nr:recombination protein RecR [Bacteroidales bacterium]